MRYFFIYNTISGLRSYRLEQPTITVGALPSNHLVLAGKAIEPIHAVIEKKSDGSWKITDLGSETGIVVNGEKIDVEFDLKPGDKILLGSVELHYELQVPDNENLAPADAARGRVVSDQKSANMKKKPIVAAQKLFDNKNKSPSGKTLEVVSYWGDRVLEIEHYKYTSETKKKPRKLTATIGITPKDDFIAAGPKKLSAFPLAKVSSSGFTLKLAKDMKARLRRSGKIKKVNKPSTIKLSSKDIADVEYGAIRYFLLFVTLPKLVLPKHSPRDPLFLGLFLIGICVFVLSFSALLLVDLPDKKSKEDDRWFVHTGPSKSFALPEKEAVKKKAVDLKPVKKQPPKPLVPQIKPKPKPKVNPKEVVAKKKPQKVTKVTPPPKINKLLQTPPKPAKKPPSKPAVKALAAKKPGGSAKKTSAVSDAVAAGVKKVPLTKKNIAKSASAGGGGGAAGGKRKGKSKSDVHGVEGVSNNKGSGVNLAQLGQSAGKILNKAGAGAINTNFKSSSGGGLGGGSGSVARTSGLGGSLTQGSSLGLEGSSQQINKFGSGGGLLSGVGGKGGFSISGKGGKRRAPINVNVGSGGAPGVSGGLSQSEVTKIIRANQNAIRHCYERLLQKNPSAAGKIKAQFVIGANGRVVSVTKQSDSVGSSSFSECIFQKIRTWSFPKPVNGQKVVVSYPWVFNPL